MESKPARLSFAGETHKICIPLFCLLLTTSSFSQKLPNPKIGENEAEITSFILSDNRLAIGGQFVYRLSFQKSTKIGIGVLYAADYGNPSFDDNTLGYGAAFGEIIQFMGRRQKWGFDGQIGHGLYHGDIYGIKLKAGIYSSIAVNYRSILSKKVLLTTALFMGYRSFYYEGSQRAGPQNTGCIGLRAGVVF